MREGMADTIRPVGMLSSRKAMPYAVPRAGFLQRRAGGLAIEREPRVLLGQCNLRVVR